MDAPKLRTCLAISAVSARLVAGIAVVDVKKLRTFSDFAVCGSTLCGDRRDRRQQNRTFSTFCDSCATLHENRVADVKKLSGARQPSVGIGVVDVKK